MQIHKWHLFCVFFFFFHVTLSSSWYQMHPRIGWNSDPRTSDISSDLRAEHEGLQCERSQTHPLSHTQKSLFHTTEPLCSCSAHLPAQPLVYKTGAGWYGRGMAQAILQYFLYAWHRQQGRSSHKHLAQLSLFFSLFISFSNVFPGVC